MLRLAGLSRERLAQLANHVADDDAAVLGAGRELRGGRPPEGLGYRESRRLSDAAKVVPGLCVRRGCRDERDESRVDFLGGGQNGRPTIRELEGDPAAVLRGDHALGRAELLREAPASTVETRARDRRVVQRRLGARYRLDAHGFA